jgi:hypothetical protein
MEINIEITGLDVNKVDTSTHIKRQTIYGEITWYYDLRIGFSEPLSGTFISNEKMSIEGAIENIKAYWNKFISNE